jgi:Cu2+-exporting ATPase
MAAELICSEGLEAFFGQREGFGRRPEEAAEFPYADPDFVARISTRVGDEREVSLELEGIHCAACVWLIERVLDKTPGVAASRVNLTARRLTLRWDPRVIDLSAIASRLASLGYPAIPYDASGSDRRARRQQRTLLMRIGVAGLAAAGAMFLGEPLNWGGFGASEQTLRHFLAWSSLLVSAPATLFAGWPYFRGAVTGMRAGALTMDATISLAALVAFVASAWAIATGQGPVYFDCVLSFLFLLLIGKAIEGAARRHVLSAAERHWRLEAPMATILEGDEERRIPTQSVRVGALLLVRPGETIPVDGVVETGEGHVDEAMLTGESIPVAKHPESPVTAGTVNLEGALRVRAVRVGSETALAQIVRWVADSDAAQAPSQRLADRVAVVFLPTLIAVAALTFWLNLATGMDAAVRNTVAVLIVTCPCALGLATPAAIAVAMAHGAKRGLLFKGGAELEGLHRITDLVLDKTGTVTTGRMRVRRVWAAAGNREEDVLAIASSIEGLSEHPLGRAIAEKGRELSLPRRTVEAFQAVPGGGVKATVAGEPVAIGSIAWLGTDLPDDLPAPQGDGTLVYLRASGRIIGGIEVADDLRADAAETVAALRGRGVALTLLSGDRPEVVAASANRLGIEDYRAGVLPQDKRSLIEGRKGRGRLVAMLGDGVNDAPALKVADIGIAMGQGAAISASAAGVVLLGDRLAQMLEATSLSARTVRVIRSNFALSAVYNALVVPLAATGHLSPQWAAVLMPLSSLLVLGNSLRLAR